MPRGRPKKFIEEDWDIAPNGALYSEDVLTELGIAEFKDRIPWPNLWFVLILEWQPTEEKTTGGIIIPSQHRAILDVGNYMGIAVALGPLAYSHRRFCIYNPEKDCFEKTQPALSPGMKSVFSKHTGNTYKVSAGDRELKFRFIADDTTLGSPESFAGMSVGAYEAA